MKSNVFVAIPPFTQLNTPYPSTAYIKGFLNTLNVNCTQADLGIETILKIFSKEGLEYLFEEIKNNDFELSENSLRITSLHDEYIQTINPVINFLQGNNPTLALLICAEDFLPQASRFNELQELDWAFGSMGTQDKAKHLATLYLEDLSDLIIDTVDPNFGFSRYAERLGRSTNSFDELYSALNAPLTYVDDILLNIIDEKFNQTVPNLFLISVPFPGNLYSAFRLAQWCKKKYPNTKIALGGGFPNTELRSISDVRVFEFFDYITLDDGERPISEILKNLEDPTYNKYKRTFILKENKVVYINNSILPDYKQSEIGTPDYSDLFLDKYISAIEVVNPMHRMWSDGRWNKLTMAHGCYWGKCTFCDISLDYIKIYEPVSAQLICDRIETLTKETGVNGFHFVDEAAPPSLMKALALEIIKRKLKITWWTNIRFEKSFTADLCILLKASGCIAVSGGLEVASDRLLNLIDKGVTVKQVANVTKNLTEAGIMVHAYLMYGYPTQTIQETIDSLEMVRQLFEEGILQSGFWHQFALTAHSPIGINPSAYKIKKDSENIGTFANNDIDFKDETNIDHGKFSFGLKKSLFNYMHGICFEYNLQEWFDFKVPTTTIDPDYIYNCINEFEGIEMKPNTKIVWLGNTPSSKEIIIKTKNKEVKQLNLIFHSKSNTYEINLEIKHGKWLIEFLQKSSVKSGKSSIYKNSQEDFENTFEESYLMFWSSDAIQSLKKEGELLFL